MNATPAWCETFLAHMREMARRHGRCDAKRAAELSGTYRMAAYRHRWSEQGSAFREEWDRILLEARQIHSSRHRH